MLLRYDYTMQARISILEVCDLLQPSVYFAPDMLFTGVEIFSGILVDGFEKETPTEAEVDLRLMSYIVSPVFDVIRVRTFSSSNVVGSSS